MKEKEFDFKEFEKDAMTKLQDGVPLTGKDGIFTPLIKRFLEASLEGELTNYLEEDPDPNRRNGYIKKSVKTGIGKIPISSPRDRNSSFEPQLIKKRQRVLNEELDQKIISLYTRGVSYSDIRSHLEEMYGLEVSDGTLSQVTDQVIADVKAWQDRPLECFYPIIWMDAIHFKVRDSTGVKNKAVYCIIGLNNEGYKDLLGMYIGEEEGAKFWLSVLSHLRDRGIKDVLIACIDNLSGFSEAIESIFPQTDVQLCIVHQIRNTLRYVPYKESRAVVKDMKAIYKALSKEQADIALEEFAVKWKAKYPHTVKSWQKNWGLLSNYYKYPAEIRKIIYTTNIIENFNAQLRKITKTKRSFSSDMALMKILYLVQKKYVKEKWKNPVLGWKTMKSQFLIIFGDRYIE